MAEWRRNEPSLGPVLNPPQLTDIYTDLILPLHLREKVSA